MKETWETPDETAFVLTLMRLSARWEEASIGNLHKRRNIFATHSFSDIMRDTWTNACRKEYSQNIPVIFIRRPQGLPEHRWFGGGHVQKPRGHMISPVTSTRAQHPGSVRAPVM